MRLKDYGRKPKLRKEFVNNPKLLIVGVDIGRSSHSACFGTNSTVSSKKFDFKNSRNGFKKFEFNIRKMCKTTKCKQILVGMEPSGLYWYGLYERLKKCGFSVCLANCMAVKNNRKTMHDGSSKTDPKDAYSIYDLLTQGKFFLPVERDPELWGHILINALILSYSFSELWGHILINALILSYSFLKNFGTARGTPMQLCVSCIV